MASHIGRRKFLATLGGAAASWPLAARTQQHAMPVIRHKERIEVVGMNSDTPRSSNSKIKTKYDKDAERYASGTISNFYRIRQ